MIALTRATRIGGEGDGWAGAFSNLVNAAGQWAVAREQRLGLRNNSMQMVGNWTPTPQSNLMPDPPATSRMGFGVDSNTLLIGGVALAAVFLLLK